MNTNDFISEIAANLDDWNVDYTETSDGFGIGLLSVRVAEESGQALATVLDGANLVAITSDADKAAALLAFPLARKAWDAGYTGDFEIDTMNGEMDMRLSYGSDDVTVSADVDADGEFTVTEHPLFSKSVTMTDLTAVLESTQLAYQDPSEAWQTLCGATNFEADDWGSIVDFFSDVHVTHGARFTKVESYTTEEIALVEDWDKESPARVIDVESAEDTTHWAMSDVAAAVLYAIS